MTKVSVIVPMYKGKNYIGPCIRSLKRQGIDDLEIIVVDDKSPDDSYQYAQDLFKGDPKVRILEQEKNGGPGQARNRGLNEASGEYVCFADLDDLYIDGAIGEMLETAEKENGDVVYTSGLILTLADPEPDDLSSLGESDLLRFAFERESEGVPEGKIEILGDLQERCENWLSHRYHWNVWGRLYRRSLLEEHRIRFPAISLGEDYLFSLNVLLHAENYVKMTKCLYTYRSNTSSISRAKGNVKLFLNALNAMFDTPASIDEMTKDLLFFEKNPEYRERLAALQTASAEGGYAVPQYQQIGRKSLEENADVASVFRKAFGKKGDFVRKTLFDSYSVKPILEAETGEGLESLAYRKKMKEKLGSGILYVLP